MTKFQALFVLWLRHEKFKSCSWRALSAHYKNRYNSEGKLKPFEHRVNFNGSTFGGDQIEGMKLEMEAFKILFPEPLFMQPFDLFEADLTQMDAKLSRHYY